MVIFHGRTNIMNVRLSIPYNYSLFLETHTWLLLSHLETER